MADGYIDLTPIIRAVERSEARMTASIGIVSGQISETQARLQALRAEVEEMRRQQAFAAALQRALTEIIRVRQELEEKFGTHKLVREYMLGILQAADLSLIQESTISRCTEELMLSAPNYWLAPCLIALSAWISNNESLAKRAVKEAMIRDEEKTSLLFALVCRRNGRTNTCFEWLSRYFALQNPKNMRKSIIAYIDAYSNGVFGEDKDNVCKEHIQRWMKSLKDNNPNFDAQQQAYWENYYARIASTMPSLGQDYEVLKSICLESNTIDEYVRRIVAVDNAGGIRASFNEILVAEIDRRELVEEIDNQLKLLVTEYEKAEEGLRKEEQYFSLVKKYSGNEELARKFIQADEKKRYDPPVDFAQRLSRSITEGGESSSSTTISAKKTAVRLLSDYIEGAFDKFVTEKQGTYPQEIGLVITEPGVKVSGAVGNGFKWSARTRNAENRESLKTSLGSQYDKTREEAVSKINNLWAYIWFGVAGALLLLGFIVGIVAAVGAEDFFSFFMPMMVFGIGAFLVAFFLGFRKMKKNKRNKETLTNYYNAQKAKNLNILDTALDARVRINKLVEDFEANENSKKLF